MLGKCCPACEELFGLYWLSMRVGSRPKKYSLYSSYSSIIHTEFDLRDQYFVALVMQITQIDLKKNHQNVDNKLNDFKHSIQILFVK